MEELPPKLSEALRDRLNDAVIQSCLDAVKGSSTRDDNAVAYWNQLNGVGNPRINTRGLNGCALEDPLTEELHRGEVAQAYAIFSQQPYCQIKPTNPDDVDNAALLEAAFSIKAEQWGLAKALHKICYTGYAQMQVTPVADWKIVPVKKRASVQIDPLTGQPTPDGLQLEGVGYKPAQEVSTDYVSGPDVRVPNPEDIYIDPPNGCDVEEAERVFERQIYTKSGLVAGITQRSFDKKAVLELIRTSGGRQVGSDYRKDRNESDGVAPSIGEGEYEVFVCYGKLPLVFASDGELDTPDDLLDERFLWVFEASTRTVLKGPVSCSYECPYTDIWAFPVPNSRNGKCVPSIAETLNDQATHTLRSIQDNLDMALNAPIIESQTSLDRNTGFEGSPFERYGIRANELPPQRMSYDSSAIGPAYTLLQDIRNRGRDLVGSSGEGISQVSSGERSASEVMQVNQTAATVRSLSTEMIAEGLSRLYGKIICLWLHYMADSGETLYANGQSVSITPDMLEGANARYQFVVSANSVAVNPEQRAMRTANTMQIVQQYQLSLMQMPQFAAQNYQLARRALQDNNERNIDKLLGPDPMAGVDPAQLLMQIAQAAQEAAAQGDPFGFEVLQFLQQQEGGGATEPGGIPGSIDAAPVSGTPALTGTEAGANNGQMAEAY